MGHCSQKRQNHSGLGANVQSEHSRLVAVLWEVLSLDAPPCVPPTGSNPGSVGLSEIQETPGSSPPSDSLAETDISATAENVGALGGRSEGDGFDMRGAV